MDDPLLPYGSIISSLVSFLYFFDVFSSSLVNRTANMLAHALAHFPLLSLDCLGALLPIDLALII